jgi:transposase
MAGRKHTEETKKMLKAEIASRDSSCWVRGEDKFNAIFTNEDIINIKKLIYDGTKIKDIAEIYNCGANTITQIKTGERWSHIKTEYDDLITQTPRQKLSEKDVIEIKRLLIEQELTIKEIAELFNITFGMVSIIKRLQSWKNVGEEYNEELIRRNIVNKLNKNKVIEIRKLLNDGKDYREIAELFGVDKTSISYIRDNKTWKEVS